MLSRSIIRKLSKIIPQKNLRLNLEDRYVYSFDSSNLHGVVADAVVFVESIEEIQQIVKLANVYKVPIIARGAGTNTVGACVPTRGGIILNFSKMNKILEINISNMTAKVQAGAIVGKIQEEVESLGLFYPPDPSNLKVSTIGGSVAQNSAGARCFKYGATKNYILSLKVVLPNGDILETGSDTIKNSTGYNMTSLFVGSEGTLGIVVEATLKLIPKPKSRIVVSGFFDNIENSVKLVDEIIKSQIMPSTIDFMDNSAICNVEEYANIGLPKDKASLILVELDGDIETIRNQEFVIANIMKSSGASQIQSASNEDEIENIWRARRLSMAACTSIKPSVTTDDMIVPRQNLSKLVIGVQQIAKNYDLKMCMVGHIGDGCVHPQIPIDKDNKEEFMRYEKAKSEMYELTSNLGGIISSEHGIGLEKKAYVDKFVDIKTLEYMKKLKKLFDPNNILNPDKIF